MEPQKKSEATILFGDELEIYKEPIEENIAINEAIEELCGAIEEIVRIVSEFTVKIVDIFDGECTDDLSDARNLKKVHRTVHPKQNHYGETTDKRPILSYRSRHRGS